MTTTPVDACRPVGAQRPVEVLLTPGPVSPFTEVVAAFSAPPPPHYGPDWVSLYERVRRRSAEVFRSKEETWLIFAPGMATIEMGLRTCLSPGDPVIVCVNGVFGERIAKVAGACGLRVTTVEAPFGHPLEPEAVAAAAARLPGLRAICVVHHETGIGLLNPIEEIGQAIRGTDALLVVDAISSLGGVEVNVGAWQADICVGVANKCLGAPVGVALLDASERVWVASAGKKDPSAGWYLNLETWRDAQRARPLHPTPVTMPTATVSALDAALGMALDEGLEARFARFRSVSQRVRAELREYGFEAVVEDAWASPVTTAVYAPDGFDPSAYMRWLREQYGLVVAGGLGPLSDRIIRIGHMARACDDEIVDRLLAATATYMRSA